MATEVTTPIKIRKVKVLELKEFHADRLNRALGRCFNENHTPIFMHELIDIINFSPTHQIGRDNQWFSTPSLRAIGKTRHGNPIVLYSHATNYFSLPTNISKSIKQGLVDGAGIIPQEEFESMIAMDGITDAQGNRLVWVLDYDGRPIDGLVQIREALRNKQITAFLGGEKKAEKFLKTYEKEYGSRYSLFGNKIGVNLPNDLVNKPLGRLLFYGRTYGSLNGYDFPFDIDTSGLSEPGHFLGVPNNTRKMKQPTLEEILKISRSFLPNFSRSQFEKELRGLYEQ